MTRPNESAEVREGIVRALRPDLVGPWAGHPLLADERLPGWARPSNWYLTGFLVPRGAPADQRADADVDDDPEVAESAGLGDDSTDAAEVPFLCLLAGYLEWHLRRAFAPLLFDDETLAETRRTRDPGAPAKPTDRARHRKACRRTDDGTPLHSLDTLIAELATRCRNTSRVPADPTAPPPSLLTEPTPTQRRAAHLIEMFPVPGTPKS